MEEKKFKSMLILIVPDVVKLILENYPWDEVTASKNLYNSELYENLEDEQTKLWHLSPLTLFSMFDEEQKTGNFVYPEET